jgi:hypothetical protein
LSEDVILYLLGGMLGFGGLRSFDKIRGVASDNPTYPMSSSKTVTTETKVVTPASAPIVPPGFGDPLPEEAPWSAKK